MSKKRYFDSGFWSDTWVVDNLNPHDRYLFIYLITNPHVTLCGVYQLSLRIMAFETGIESETLVGMLRRLKPKVEYEEGWIILRNGIKNQNYRNEKIKANIDYVLSTVPEHILQQVIYPKDFGRKPKSQPQQTRLIDESSMSHHIIMNNNNNNNNNAPPAGGFGKPNKSQYSKVIKADQKLKAKEQATRTRASRSTVESVREQLSKKGIVSPKK